MKKSGMLKCAEPEQRDSSAGHELSEVAAKPGVIEALVLWGVILSGIFWSANLALQTPVNCDEMEHLHAAWLWNQGVQPFTGFSQHHPPAFWLVLRPLVSGSSRNLLEILTNGRILSWITVVLTIGGVYWLSLRLFGKTAALCAAGFWSVFCASCAVAIHIRPDILMLAMMLCGTALAVEGFGLSLGGGHRSRVRILLGGMLVAAAVCVLPKAVFWMIALAASLAALAVYARRSRKDKSAMIDLGVFAVGLAIPAAIQLIWILGFNDFKQFWFCNVTSNARIANAIWGIDEATKSALSGPASWPMLSAPLAALGAAVFAGLQGSGAGARKLILLALVLSGAALVLMSNGPWAHYSFPLLVLLAGLAGLGLAWACERLSKNARMAVWITLLFLATLWPWSNLPEKQVLSGRPVSALEASLECYQYVVDSARPGDTCLSLTNFSPVLIMDADPKLFMHLMCFQKLEDLQIMVDAIVRDKPRFIVGPDNVLLVSHGGLGKLKILMAPPEEGGGVWLTHPNIGKVPADEVHRWYDWARVGVLERRQAPRQGAEIAR